MHTAKQGGVTDSQVARALLTVRLLMGLLQEGSCQFTQHSSNSSTLSSTEKHTGTEASSQCKPVIRRLCLPLHMRAQLC